MIGDFALELVELSGRVLLAMSGTPETYQSVIAAW